MTGVIACAGEVLLRYSPPEPLLVSQTDSFRICTGGAEANVAVGLASLGHATRQLSVLPDNPLGQRAAQDLSACGVDTASIIRSSGRMGAYVYQPPAGIRPGQVTYDREASAFALSSLADWPIDEWLDGVTHLHVSGITLALSEALAEAKIELVKSARQRGATVSFDANYRAALWDKSDRDPLPSIKAMMASADLVFANHKDAGLLLGREFSGEGSERRREAALALIEAFPSIAAIASTARHIEDADTHTITARIDTREDAARTHERRISGIVDRIGTGDAFAAGVLDAWLTDRADIARIAESGLGLTALKHATWGDFSLASRTQLEAALGGHCDVMR